MPKRRTPLPLPEDDEPDIDEEEFETVWEDQYEEDFPELDTFDELEDWLDHEDEWDEDRYQESS